MTVRAALHAHLRTAQTYGANSLKTNSIDCITSIIGEGYWKERVRTIVYISTYTYMYGQLYCLLFSLICGHATWSESHVHF